MMRWQLPPNPAQLAAELTADRVDLWQLAWPQWRDLVESQAHVLSADERQRAARFRQEGDRQRYILARIGLRDILSRYRAIAPHALQFSYGAKGKPYLETQPGVPPLEFNLSHSGDWVGVAIARLPVGFDLEAIRPIPQLDAILHRHFTASEQATLQPLDEAAKTLAFFRGWTAKEAFLKATGLGISAALNSVAIALEPGTAPHFCQLPPPLHLADWSLHTFDLAPHYPTALAIAHPSPVLHFWQWSPNPLPSD